MTSQKGRKRLRLPILNILLVILLAFIIANSAYGWNDRVDQKAALPLVLIGIYASIRLRWPPRTKHAITLLLVVINWCMAFATAI